MGFREEGLQACAEVRERIYPFFLRTVSIRERDDILAHTASCGACRLTLEAVRERLDGVLEVEQAPPNAPRPRSRRPRLLLTALYVVPAVIAFSLLIQQGIKVGRHRYEQLFVNRLARAIYLYREDFGRFPPADDAPLSVFLGTSDQGGPYLDLSRERLDATGHFIDYWGNRYVYRFPGRIDARIFDLQSPGQNGRDDVCRNDDICN